MTALPPLTVEFTASGDGISLVRRFGTAAVIGMRAGLRRGMLRAQNRGFFNARGGAVTGRTLVLAKSVRGFVRDGEDGLPVGVLGVAKGLADKYARILEVGTVGAGGLLPDVVPVKAKALAIPLPAAKDKRGVPLYSGPRDPEIAKKIFLIARKGKPALLAIHSDVTGENRKRGQAGENILPLYILSARSKVPPKRYLRRALTDSAPEIARDVNQAIAAELVKKGGPA